MARQQAQHTSGKDIIVSSASQDDTDSLFDGEIEEYKIENTSFDLGMLGGLDSMELDLPVDSDGWGSSGNQVMLDFDLASKYGIPQFDIDAIIENYTVSDEKDAAIYNAPMQHDTLEVYQDLHTLDSKDDELQSRLAGDFEQKQSNSQNGLYSRRTLQLLPSPEYWNEPSIQCDEPIALRNFEPPQSLDLPVQDFEDPSCTATLPMYHDSVTSASMEGQYISELDFYEGNQWAKYHGVRPHTPSSQHYDESESVRQALCLGDCLPHQQVASEDQSELVTCVPNQYRSDGYQQAQQQTSHQASESKSQELIISPKQDKNRPPRTDPRRPHVRINKKTKGMNSRSAKAEHLSARGDHIYRHKDTPAPFSRDRGGWQSGTGSRFHYDENGELASAEISANQLMDFLYHHPPVSLDSQGGHNKDDPDAGKMALWIQRVPADSARRYNSHTMHKCRLQECPIPTGVLRPGHYQVAFDERWALYGSEADPYNVVMYVHLFCLERFLSLPQICKLQNVVVKVDTRTLKGEDNKMTPAPELSKLFSNFLHICGQAKDEPELRVQLSGEFEGYPLSLAEKSQPDYSAVYNKTLNYIAQKHENLKRSRTALATFQEHMGDLERFQQREDHKKKKRLEAEEKPGFRRSPRDHPGSPRFVPYPGSPHVVQQAGLRRSPRFAPQSNQFNAGVEFFPQESLAERSHRLRLQRITDLNSRTNGHASLQNLLSVDLAVDNMKGPSIISNSPRRSPRRVYTYTTEDSSKTASHISPKSILRTPETPRLKRKTHIAWAEENDVLPDPVAWSADKKQKTAYRDMQNARNWTVPKIKKAPPPRLRQQSVD